MNKLSMAATLVGSLSVFACMDAPPVDTGPRYAVGGTVLGLQGTIELSNNGNDSLILNSIGDLIFVFDNTVADAGDYQVEVVTQPAGQLCAASSNTGTIAGADVSDVIITCMDSGPPKLVNDTGITTCGDYAHENSQNHTYNLKCRSVNATQTEEGIDNDGDPVPAGQDAVYGRDVTNKYGRDGRLGFSFTKIDGNGNPIPLGANNWSCVQDNVTRLIWEVKTRDSGNRDMDNLYTWLNTNSSENGGIPGSGGAISYYCTGFDESDPATWCNTEAYVARVNASGLCGANDWRMPSAEELQSLVDFSGAIPSIHTAFFPNTKPPFTGTPNYYWTATPQAYSSSPNAQVKRIEFFTGVTLHSSAGTASYVRLVRDSQ